MMVRHTVDLPLHTGKCPKWLFEKMVRLSRAILLLIYEEFGEEELLKRLCDPWWFQALGCLLGFDWHSSGLTTTVGAAIKEALRPYFSEINLFICGGKGKTALKTPEEILNWGEKAGLPGSCEKLINFSRLVARIDNNAIQDGFQLYFHLFVFTKKGRWGVVQQGMEGSFGYARRYHWQSFSLKDPCEDPHKAIVSAIKKQEVLNLVSRKSRAVKGAILNVLKEDLKLVLHELRMGGSLFFKPSHSLTEKDLSPKVLRKIWERTYNNPPQEFRDLLLTPGLGAKALRALTLTAELIYDVKACREDPACYAYAHGGKDGHPYKVNRKVYEHTILELEEILRRVKLSQRDKVSLFKRLPRLYNTGFAGASS